MAMSEAELKRGIKKQIEDHKKALTLLPGDAHSEILLHNEMIDYYQNLLRKES